VVTEGEARNTGLTVDEFVVQVKKQPAKYRSLTLNSKDFALQLLKWSKQAGKKGRKSIDGSVKFHLETLANTSEGVQAGVPRGANPDSSASHSTERETADSRCIAETHQGDRGESLQ